MNINKCMCGLHFSHIGLHWKEYLPHSLVQVIWGAGTLFVCEQIVFTIDSWRNVQ